MTWESTPYAAVLIASAAVCAALVVYTHWYTKKYDVDRTVIAFGVLMAGMSFYSLSRGIGFGYTTRPEKLLWARLLYLGFVPGVAAWFVFAVEYGSHGRRLSRRLAVALGLYVGVVISAALTNPWHQLLWSTDPELTVVTGETLATLDRAFRPAFVINIIIAYALFVVGLVLLLRTAVSDKHLFHSQAIAVSVGAIIPVVTALPFIFGISPGGIDFTPVAYAFSGLLYGYAIFRYRFLEIRPVVRDTVIAEMRDGFVVLDYRDRIVDYNEAAAQLLDAQTLIGMTIDSVLPPTTPGEDRATGAQTSVFQTDDGRYIEIERSVLAGDGRQSGSLLTFRDITERKRHKQEQQQRNERLEKFANIVSHDLRNPLNVASGRLDLARENRDSEQLEIVSHSLARMETIIDDTLSLARQGQTVAEPENVDLGAVATRSWSLVDTAGATLDCRVSIRICADPDRLQQIFENLFRNSIEHGRSDEQPPGQVEQSPEQAEQSESIPTSAVSSLVIRVGSLDNGFYLEDNGVGIPEALRDSLFDPGMTTSEGGTGFGLAIVKEIVVAHGWEISVTESDTGGARFEVIGVELASKSATR